MLCSHRERFSLVDCGERAAVPSSPKPTIQGPSNWINETPKLPIPAWMPNAVPAIRLGKKYPVEGM